MYANILTSSYCTTFAAPEGIALVLLMASGRAPGSFSFARPNAAQHHITLCLNIQTAMENHNL